MTERSLLTSTRWGRDFRLGAFADLKVWNPEDKDIPESRPLCPSRSLLFCGALDTRLLYLDGIQFRREGWEGPPVSQWKGPRGDPGMESAITWKSDEASVFISV